ncbi:TWiK family of potassium channels protein 7-like [Limulus polyphemus]|uniref:TWiK family of potassium channels protein 7-like n=1 Tax=Limulus polyphemus TaxID=6850 RepID=A0ABM1B5H2_LIMPO|nr:TWiK family of potassium channels protein 7-like [Limulus polyphemus]
MLRDVEEQEDPIQRTKWKRCLRLLAVRLFSDVGICSLALSYAIVGALVFEALETQHELSARSEVRKLRIDCMRDLWRITNELNVLYEKNWTLAVDWRLTEFEQMVVNAVKNEGYDGRDMEATERQWSFSGALFYSLTVTTTVGYGNMAPKTNFGKVVTIFYSIVGVPLMLLCLTKVGYYFSRLFRFIYFHICCVRCREQIQFRQIQKAVNMMIRKQMPSSSSSFPNDQASVEENIQPWNPGQQLVEETAESGQSSPSDQLNDYNNLISHEKRNHWSTNNQTAMSHESNENSCKMSTLNPAVEESQNLCVDISNKFPYARRNNTKSSSLPPSFTHHTSKLSLSDVAFLNNKDNASHNQEKHIPMYVVILFVVAYIFIGAMIFSLGENWSFLNGAYFCFVALSTIGFGNLVPGSYKFETHVHSGQARLIIGSFYMILGLAVVIMAYHLTHEEVILKCKTVARNLGILSSNENS